MGFREIGAGHESIKTFSRIMNLSPPVAVNAYNDINDKLYEAFFFMDFILEEKCTWFGIKI